MITGRRSLALAATVIAASSIFGCSPRRYTEHRPERLDAAREATYLDRVIRDVCLPIMMDGASFDDVAARLDLKKTGHCGWLTGCANITYCRPYPDRFCVQPVSVECQAEINRDPDFARLNAVVDHSLKSRGDGWHAVRRLDSEPFETRALCDGGNRVRVVTTGFARGRVLGVAPRFPGQTTAPATIVARTDAFDLRITRATGPDACAPPGP